MSPLTLKLPLIVRLGGFHLLKSFLGSFRYIMEGSGIEDLIKSIYPGSGDPFVNGVLSGGAYYEALRCHFLIDAAIVNHIMKGKLSEDDLRAVEDFLLKTLEKEDGCKHPVSQVMEFQLTLESVVKNLKSNGRTNSLWLQYHQHVSLMKVYIRAERLHDLDAQLSSVNAMLTTFAAAGHLNYAKGARLYLELMERYEVDHAKVVTTFAKKGYHTVRYNTDQWFGVWSDLAIEQRLMKPLKSIGGLKQGRFRNPDNSHKLWCSTADHLSDVNELMSKPINTSSRARTVQPHIDARASSRKRDNRIIQQLSNWLQENDPFDSDRQPGVLVSFNTGLISREDDHVNPENAYSIGLAIQSQHDGLGFSATMHSKDKVKPLSNLKKPVKVKEKDIYIDP